MQSVPAQTPDQLPSIKGQVITPTMRAVMIQQFGEPLTVQQIPIPQLKSGEVLIKVEAAPINPVDMEFLRGMSIRSPDLPCQVGYEGTGTVILHEESFLSRSLVGKKVAFGTAARRPGSWAQYVVTEGQHCIPLDQNIPIEVAACGVINPFTAVAFVEIAKKDKHKAVVQTAAASQVGKMMIKLLKKEGIKTINIVRKADQKKMLEEIGGDVVLNSEEEGFEEELKRRAEELQGTMYLECICGEVTHKVLRALPRGSVCYVYGHLAKEETADVDFEDFVKNQKSMKPFIFKNWLRDQGIFTKLGALKKVQKLLMSDLKSEISKTFRLDEVNEALKYYSENMSSGKVLIMPGDM